MTIRKFFRKIRDEAKDKIARVEARLAPSKAPSKRPTIKLMSTVPYFQYHRGSVKHRNAPDPAEHSDLLIRNPDPESPSTEPSTRNFDFENYLVESSTSDSDAETASIGSCSTLISFGSLNTLEEFPTVRDDDSDSISSSASSSPIMMQDTISAIYTLLEYYTFLARAISDSTSSSASSSPIMVPDTISASIYTLLEYYTFLARAIETNDTDATLHHPHVPGCWHGASSAPNPLAQTADVSTTLALHPAFRTDLPHLHITPPDSPTTRHSLFLTTIFHDPYPSNFLQALPNHLFRNPSRSTLSSPSFVREDSQFTFTTTSAPSSPAPSSSASSPSDVAVSPAPNEPKNERPEMNFVGG